MKNHYSKREKNSLFPKKSGRNSTATSGVFNVVVVMVADDYLI